MITETDACPMTGDRPPEPRDHKIRVCLAGVLGNAARCIERLAAEVRERAAWHHDCDDDDPADNPESDTYMLREIAKHCDGLVKGVHTLDDFADFYCLVQKQEPV